MSRIKGKDTKPEILVRKFFFTNGLRYRLHYKKLPGKPDIIFPMFKTVIFINGCFWHGHKDCKYFILPKTRTEWWSNKINLTIERDSVNVAALESLGWKVITIWECELKTAEKEKTLALLMKELIKNG